MGLNPKLGLSNPDSEKQHKHWRNRSSNPELSSTLAVDEVSADASTVDNAARLSDDSGGSYQDDGGHFSKPCLGEDRDENIPACLEELAQQILLCQTWVAAANKCNCDGAILQSAIEVMSPLQQSRVPELMIAHLLGTEPELLAIELKTMWEWVTLLPPALQEQVWGGLRFTLKSMGEFTLHEDPIVIKTPKCRLRAVEEKAFGTRQNYTSWVFQAPDGEIIDVGEGWFELER